MTGRRRKERKVHNKLPLGWIQKEEEATRTGQSLTHAVVALLTMYYVSKYRAIGHDLEWVEIKTVQEAIIRPASRSDL